MKINKIVSGRRYDTETAQHCGHAVSPRVASDSVLYWEADLYRKKTGEYFLVTLDCDGIPDFAPMGDDAARIWAEKWLDGDGYETIFGPVPE